MASCHNQSQILKYLIEEEAADVCANDHFALKIAVWNSSVEVVKFLAEYGFDFGFNSNEIFNFLFLNPGFIASYIIFRNLVLNYGIDPLVNYQEMFNRVVSLGVYEMLKGNIKIGADLNCLTQDTLVNCIMKGDEKSVKLLIENGVDFSFINSYPMRDVMDDKSTSKFNLYQILSEKGVENENLIKLLTSSGRKSKLIQSNLDIAFESTAIQ